jgi:hypothetical protein
VQSSPGSSSTRRRSRHYVLSSEEAAAVAPTSAPTPLPVEFVAECDLPTAVGQFRLRAYRAGGAEPTVVVKGDVRGQDVLVRVHDQVPRLTVPLG